MTEIEGYVITIEGHEPSESAYSRLVSSSSLSFGNTFTLRKFSAITPKDDVYAIMAKHTIGWNYPEMGQGSTLCYDTGLIKSPYQSKVLEKRIACFLSHYELWCKCFDTQQDMLIFEHDAIFTRKLNLDILQLSHYDIIGLNDPRGATRRSEVYHNASKKYNGVGPAPTIDAINVPQGIAGNSAYYINPQGAKRLIANVAEYGAWPNDAIMCRQLMGGKLGQLHPYLTTIQQGIVSTTVL